MNPETTEKATRQKKTYTAPSLTKYGQLKDLTTGGSAKNPETKGNQKNRP